MNVTLRQLRIFLAVAEQQHFRRAAEQLHLTPPAVSRQISELEAELGQRLFDRTTRAVLATAAGQQLRGQLEPLLDELEGALRQIRDAAEQARGKVQVAAVPTLSASLMPTCIASCQRDYPALQLLLRDQVQTLVLGAVRHGEVDFGMVIDPPPSETLHTHVLRNDPFWLVCRTDHPLATLDTVPWASLDGHPLVLLDHDSGSRRVIDRLLRKHGVNAPVAQQAGHATAVFRLVEAGLGVSIMPGLSLPLPANAPLQQRPLTPREQRAITLVRRREHRLSPSAQRVWDRLIELNTVAHGDTRP